MHPHGTDDRAVADQTTASWLRWRLSSSARACSLALGLVAVLAVATPREPSSWQARAVTTLVGLAVLLWAISRGQHRARPRPGARPRLGGARTVSLVAWLCAFGTLVAYQLAIFFSEPREVYPTLSSLINPVIEPVGIRAAAFVVWAWAGWYLVAKR